MSNSGVLSAVTLCIGKLATIVLKTPIKKLSQKEIDISVEKKKKLKEKKNLKKEKKLKFPEKFDDEEDDDDADCSADSDDEIIEDKEKPLELSQLSQSSQSSQLFDETELSEVRNKCSTLLITTLQTFLDLDMNHNAKASLLYSPALNFNLSFNFNLTST